MVFLVFYKRNINSVYQPLLYVVTFTSVIYNITYNPIFWKRNSILRNKGDLSKRATFEQ